MQKTIKPLLNKKITTLFWVVIGIASLTAGYMYARKPSGPVKIISASDVQSKVTSGAHVINVLSPKTYADAHIKGSMNIPLKQLRTRAGQFDKDQTLVVYCASSTCDASHKAAKILNRAGFHNVFVYEGGMKDWHDKGFATAGPCKMRYLYNGKGRAPKVCKVSKKKPVASKEKPTEKRIRTGAKAKPTVKTEKRNKKVKGKKTTSSKKGKAAKVKTPKTKTPKTKSAKIGTGTSKKSKKRAAKKQSSPRKAKRQRQEEKQELRFSPIE